MASTALVKAQEELAKVKARMSGARERANRSSKMIQRDATAVGGAYAYGSIKKDRQRAGQTMPTLFGLDPEVTAVGVLYAVGHFADGELGELAHDIALGVACGKAFVKAQE